MKKTQTGSRVYLLDGTPFKESPAPRSLRKSLFLLKETVKALIERHTPERVLFITLTFPEPQRSVREAQRRLNSFLTKVRRRYAGYLWVMQPHLSGAIHFHLLVPVDFDSHNKTDLTAWSERNFWPEEYRSRAMNRPLRATAQWWEEKAPKYGFGRVEVAPVYSNAGAVSGYLEKQDWRTQNWPFEEIKNVRTWSCSRNLRIGTGRFSWNGPKGKAFRRDLAAWAQSHGCHSLSELSTTLGPSWGFHFFKSYRPRPA